MKYLRLFDSYTPISENMKYHIDNNIPVLENVFRPSSKSFYALVKEARELYDSNKIELPDEDNYLFSTTDVGKFAEFEGQIVPLDLPMENIDEINEAEYHGKEVKLNKPMRSPGPKKYKVYVKNPKTGKVKCVHFGDAKGGLRAKVNNPKARRAFSQRHNCPMKKDKMTPGFWACRLTKFGYLFGNANRTYAGYW